MVYPIVKFGEPVLENPAAPVTAFDGDLRKLIEDMFESMYAAQGVGLAAPQIGIAKRIAVIDTTFKEDPEAKLILVNPVIVHAEGKQKSSEGCLSLPEFRENVTRARRVTVREDRRGAAGARLPARNRSSQRTAVHQPHQRAEARPYQAPHPQDGQSWRMVKDWLTESLAH